MTDQGYYIKLDKQNGCPLYYLWVVDGEVKKICNQPELPLDVIEMGSLGDHYSLIGFKAPDAVF